ncbi:MAG: conjugal transfer protein TrbE [Caulobacteraceae bacterium]
MLYLREYKDRPKLLCDRLPWGMLIGDGVMLNKDGAYMATLEFRGPDLASSTAEQLMVLRSQLNRAHKGLGSSWGMHTEARRNPSPHYPPKGAFPDPISQLFDQERRLDFSEGARSFETRYFLTLYYLPPGERASKVRAFVIENAPTGQGALGSYAAALDYFRNTVTAILDLYRNVMPMTKQLKSDELLTYLHACISTKAHPVKTPECPAYMDALLTDDTLTTGLMPRLGDHHLRVISIREYPQSTAPSSLDALNELPIAYRWVSRFLPLDKADALKELSRMRTLWYQGRKGLMAVAGEAITKQESPHVNQDAARRADSAESAMAIASGDFAAFGYYTPTVTLLDRDPDALAEKARLVESTLNNCGFVAKLEDVNAVEAWLGTLPGNPYADKRRPMISTLSLSDLTPVSAVYAGPQRNDHLTRECTTRSFPGDQPPLLLARTGGSTPYRLSLHQGDVAHTQVVGPTGAGKSVLLATAAIQHLRYPEARVICFDVGASMRSTTLLVGGDFYKLSADARESDLTFQPLADLDDAGALEWACGWVEDLVVGQGVQVAPDIREQIYLGLVQVQKVPTRLRTLTHLWTQVQDESVKTALRPFTHDGTFGALLDAQSSAIAGSNFITFEMADIMRSKAIFPTLAYIFRTLERLFDGRPTLLILDEAWLFIGQGTFAAKIREWLKTLRRKNVGVIFATQSLAEIASSPIAPALIESCPTKIYLPNKDALSPNTAQYYRDFNLNQRQLEVISSAIPKRDYYVTSPEGNRVIELGLGPVGLSIVGSNNKNDQTLMDQLLSQHGKGGFAEAFLRHKGFPVLAERLSQLRAAA